MDYEQLGKELEEWHGKPLPSPDHCPIQFSYIVKLFLYYRMNKS